MNVLEDKQKKNKIVRGCFLAVGLLSLVIGTIGIVIPILPTVPFYLLSMFCFVRGNRKFAQWFYQTKLYQKHVGHFAKDHQMTLIGEIFLLLFVSVMLLTSLYFINKPVMSIVFTILITMKYAYFVFRITPVSRKEFRVGQTKDA